MERPAFRVSGFVAVAGLLVLAAVGLVVILATSGGSEAATAASVSVTSSLFALAVAAAAIEFTIVNPNDAQVVQFFGRYVGSIRTASFHWAWPLTAKRRVTLRVRNFETARLKERKAQMVANLLVVLCGDRAVQPVVNTGSMCS